MASARAFAQSSPANWLRGAWKSNVAPYGISSTCEQPVEHKGSINHAEEWLMFPGCSLVSRRSSEFSECGKLIQVVDPGVRLK